MINLDKYTLPELRKGFKEHFDRGDFETAHIYMDAITAKETALGMNLPEKEPKHVEE